MSLLMGECLLDLEFILSLGLKKDVVKTPL